MNYCEDCKKYKELPDGKYCKKCDNGSLFQKVGKLEEKKRENKKNEEYGKYVLEQVDYVCNYSANMQGNDRKIVDLLSILIRVLIHKWWGV